MMIPLISTSKLKMKILNLQSDKAVPLYALLSIAPQLEALP
jgi:hypothetical protein